MSYSIVPGIANQVRANVRRQPMSMGLDASSAVAIGGVAGALVGGAIEGLYIYAVARFLGKVESPKARNTALWAGGISAGLGIILTLAGVGAAAAAADATGSGSSTIQSSGGGVNISDPKTGQSWVFSG